MVNNLVKYLVQISSAWGFIIHHISQTSSIRRQFYTVLVNFWVCYERKPTTNTLQMLRNAVITKPYDVPHKNQIYVGKCVLWGWSYSLSPMSRVHTIQFIRSGILVITDKSARVVSDLSDTQHISHGYRRHVSTHSLYTSKCRLLFQSIQFFREFCTLCWWNVCAESLLNFKTFTFILYF